LLLATMSACGATGAGGSGASHAGDQNTEDLRPAFLPPPAALGQLAVDIHEDPFRTRLPDRLKDSPTRYWGILKVCVRRTGETDSVAYIRRTGDADLDAEWATVVRRWRYKPLVRYGRRIPFCHNAKLVGP
jgi:hypothetical protein